MDSMEKALHAQALEEMVSNNMDAGIFAKALSESGGDKNKTQSLYIKFRVADLQNEVMEKAKREAKLQKEREEHEKREALKEQIIADRADTIRRKEQWKEDHPYASLIFYTFVFSIAIISIVIFFIVTNS